MRVLILVKKPVKMSYLVAFGRGSSRKVCGRQGEVQIAFETCPNDEARHNIRSVLNKFVGPKS